MPNIQKKWDKIPVYAIGEIPEPEPPRYKHGQTVAKRALLAATEDDDPEDAIVDLLADLRHLCDALGLSMADLDKRAHSHYLAELPRLDGAVADSNPRYVAYAAMHGRETAEQLVHDLVEYEGGCMTGFITWVQAEAGNFNRSKGDPLATQVDPDGFTRHLQLVAEQQKGKAP